MKSCASQIRTLPGAPLRTTSFRSSSGQGYRPFKSDDAGSNPARNTSIAPSPSGRRHRILIPVFAGSNPAGVASLGFVAQCQSTRLLPGTFGVRVPASPPICPCGATGQRASFRSSRLRVRIPPRAPRHTPVAQWMRASGYEPGGRGFKSCLGCHLARVAQPDSARSSYLRGRRFESCRGRQTER